MRKLLWTLLILASVGLVPARLLALPTQFDAIYVFGDSYCDVGNLFIADGGTVPGPPYYQGRFSNGPLWIEHVASSFNLPMKPALAGGTNFAFAGAEATADVPLGGGSSIPSVPHQIELYLQATGGKADPNALYIIEGGGNDILDATGGSPQALGYAVAGALAQSQQLLQSAGAKYFVVPNLFDVGILPAGQSNRAFDHIAVYEANKNLDLALAAVSQNSGIHILRMDVDSLLNGVLADKTHWGFKNVTSPCLTTTVCADPDHTLFWDTHHPTVFGHDLFATYLETLLFSWK